MSDPAVASPPGRLHALDALRGFALFGIILGNVTWFSGYAVASADARLALVTPQLDRALAFGLHVAVDGKFYGLFSLVFGAGFALLVEAARRKGADAARVVQRRLVALFVIGLAHATLVWFGDIVSLYAVAALPLWWVHRWPVARLLRFAGACLLAPVLVSALVLALHHGAGAPPPTEAAHGPAALLPSFAHGSYADVLAANRAFLVQRWVLALESSRLLRLLGLFALGVAAVRMRAVVPAMAMRVRGRLLWLALASNLALAFLADVSAQPPSELGLLREVVYAVAIPTGALAYAAWLWPVLSRPTPVTAALGAAGRLSLTHYLGQSLVMAVLFYGYGLGQWGRLGLTPALVVAAAIAATQIALSPRWLRRHDHGPAELVLRRFTYGRDRRRASRPLRTRSPR